ncbi:hypothetical protein I5Q34_23440 [Streptomyces sp. AV19]|uniref:hypothetical protein n=1 Tax=Streptomyces sp. AV19 TaxID=2793068 RepID=UPI0018FEA6A5|nr:hypothetical protein [Streptomyces sp. AV19]MBH1937185.1 hypothetical protein [Streptomyces sp. AV19]MDG4533458.1 hypothetical protein [Streptomyces sp. AV19]
MTYGLLPPLGALGVGGASALSARRPDSGFQALATVVAATTLIMAGASLGKLLPPRRRFTGGAVAWHTPRRSATHDLIRRDGTAWIAVP